MIAIDAALDGGGLLVSCKVAGHAKAGPIGGDVVCAAVSTLTRTALRILLDREGITLRGKASERGAFWLEMEYTGAGRDFLAGAGAFLLEGLRSVAEDYPDHCTMTIHTERRN